MLWFFEDITGDAYAVARISAREAMRRPMVTYETVINSLTPRKVTAIMDEFRFSFLPLSNLSDSRVAAVTRFANQYPADDETRMIAIAKSSC